MPGEIIYPGPPTPVLIEEYSGTDTGPKPPTDVTDVRLTVGPRTGFSLTPEGQKTEHSWDLTRTAMTAGFTDIAGNLSTIGASTLDVGTDVVIADVVAGTFVDIEGFPYICMAAALLFGEYAFGWLLNKVARLFPNPSIFGFHPLGFIQHGLHNLGNGFEGSARDIAHYLLGIILTPVHLLIRLFQEMVNAISGAHNKSTTIVKERIPEIRRLAVADAAAYTDASVATLQGDQVTALERIATDTADAVAQGKIDAADATSATWASAQSVLMERLAEDQGTLDAIQADLAKELPSQTAAAVEAAVATGNAQLAAQAVALASAIVGLQDQVTGHQSTIATREAQIANDEARIEQLVAVTPVDQAQVDALEAQVLSYKSDVVTNITAIEDLEHRITAISSTLGQVHTAQQLRVTQNTSSEVVAATALATVVATVAKAVYNLKTKVDQCMVDRCNPSGPHGLKTELLALLALLTDAGELAFLAEAVRDPQGTAATLAPVLDTIDAQAVNALNLLLSI